MDLDRRRILAASFGLTLFAGCLDDGDLSSPLDLRIENLSRRLRTLDVSVDRIGDDWSYDDEYELDPGERTVVEGVATVSGRYRIKATDTTPREEDDFNRDRLDAEVTTGENFCGWFVVRIQDDDTLTVTLPRCFDEEDETDGSG